MSFKWDRVHVWSCEVVDERGATAAKLSFLAQSGANLEYISTQRLPTKPGKGILYVAPITGPAQQRAAKAGQTCTRGSISPSSIASKGGNEPGLGHKTPSRSNGSSPTSASVA